MILPQNQFNSQGIVHNLSLDAMTSLSGFPACTANQFYNAALAEFNTIYYSSATSPAYSDCSAYISLITGGSTSTSIINQLNTDGKISSNLKTAAISFMNMINAEVNFVTWDTDVNNFISTIDGLTLSDDEKKYMYGMGSTALFSKYYWNTVAANSSNPWYNPLGGGLPPTFIKILTAIGADCLGMLIGAGVGVLIGGPAGALIGMAICGAGASAAAI